MLLVRCALVRTYHTETITTVHLEIFTRLLTSHPWVTSMTLAWQRASLGFVYWQEGVLAELEEFRIKVLGLPPKSLREKQVESEHTPLLLAYSPTVLELPEDTKSWQIGVGFWFLTEASAGADGAFSRKARGPVVLDISWISL